MASSSSNTPNKIHVLLVEHDNAAHDQTINMLQFFSYLVTPFMLASTALSILSEGKIPFDLLLTNISSPDTFTGQLIDLALKMDIPVMLMYDVDDAASTMRALEQGVFHCIKKPTMMETLGGLWQLVLGEKLRRLRVNERRNVPNNVVEAGSVNNIIHEEENKKSNSEKGVSKKRAASNEWSPELHDKFMAAVIQLGEGRCFPKDILELMNVPGLTRMQVASHLQNCRNSKWLPNKERKSKEANVETKKPPRPRFFGSMPCNVHSRKEENQEILNHQEFTMDAPTAGFNKELHQYPRRLIGHGINPFNMGQVGQSLDDQDFIYGAQIATPFNTSTIPSTHTIQNVDFALPTTDPLMVHDLPDFQQGMRMNYDGDWQSLVPVDDGDHGASTSASNQWIQAGGINEVDDAEIEGMENNFYNI